MANTLQLTDKIAVVLDLGTTKLRAVAALLDENKKVSKIIATEEADSKGVKHGRVVNYVELAGVLNPMLKRLGNRIYNKMKDSIGESFVGTPVEIKKVYIALGGKGIQGKVQEEPYRLNDQYVDLPVVQKIQENIRQRVQNDKEVILDLVNQGYNVDDDIRMEAVGSRANNVIGRFCVVTAEKGIQEDITKTLDTIRVELAGFTLLPFALAEVMLSDADKEVGATLIDLGASSTSVTVYRDNVRRHVRVLPLGSKLITKDIKNVCGLTTEDAEKLKKKYGYAYPGGVEEDNILRIPNSDVKVVVSELAAIIEARLEELIAYVLGEMNKVQALSSTRKIILTGNGARLKKVCEKFTNELGLDTEVGKIKDSYYEKYSPYFATMDGVNGNMSKAARYMNSFAACLGTLESCDLDSCVSVGKKEPVTPPTPIKHPKDGIFQGFINLFSNAAGGIVTKAEGIIDGKQI